MRMFMAAIVGLVIVGTGAWAQQEKKNKKDTQKDTQSNAAPAEERKDTHGGATGSITGKVVGVAADHSFVTIADKKGNEHKVHIGADTKVTEDGKTVEGGVKNLKAGNTVTIAWEINTHGQRVGTAIKLVEHLGE
jgi:hypothetical protein